MLYTTAVAMLEGSSQLVYQSENVQLVHDGLVTALKNDGLEGLELPPVRCLALPFCQPRRVVASAV